MHFLVSFSFVWMIYSLFLVSKHHHHHVECLLISFFFLCRVVSCMQQLQQGNNRPRMTCMVLLFSLPILSSILSPSWLLSLIISLFRLSRLTLFPEYTAQLVPFLSVGPYVLLRVL